LRRFRQRTRLAGTTFQGEGFALRAGGNIVGVRGRRRAIALAVVIASIAALAVVGGASGARTPSLASHGVRYAVRPVPVVRAADPGSVVRTDPALLRLRSSRAVPVLVRLRPPALASYSGGIRGLAPTSPRRTGRAISLGGRAERRYLRYLAAREARLEQRARRLVPGVRFGTPLRVVYDGVTAMVPGNRIAALAALPGVVAIQRDTLRHQLDDGGSTFAAASVAATPEVGAATGAGVVIAVIDSGVWPEHPSLADDGTLPAPPPTRSGAARVCNFGDDPLTPAPDVFACTRKLIGGDVFLARYAQVLGLEGELYPGSARDGDGHGTHTATVAAGGAVAHTDVAGVDRGATSGVAPGAAVLAYKALSRGFGYDSDLVAAIERGIADGADVIAYPVSGGRGDPATDPVAAAFLDADNAGVTVVAAAGNDGPAAETVDHVAPWIITAGAVTGPTDYRAALHVTAGAATLDLVGASAGAGLATPHALVDAGAVPAYAGGAECRSPADPGTFDGAIVICRRGTGSRLARSTSVAAGGAAGMVLVGGTDVGADPHRIPTVHLAAADGDALLAFLDAHADATSTLDLGAPAPSGADVVAPFSGRGGSLAWLKPDLAAVGVAVLGGTTPTPDATTGGMPGALYAVASGTSAAAANAAGAAVVLRAGHPTWTPAQVRSALATTAAPSAANDGPLAIGSGRIDLAAAANPGLTFDAPGPSLAAAVAGGPAARLAANLPAIVAPDVPGIIETERTAVNVSAQPVSFTTVGETGAGWSIDVAPAAFTLAPGAAVTLHVTIDAGGASRGTYAAAVHLNGTIADTGGSGTDGPDGGDGADDGADDLGDHDQGDGRSGDGSRGGHHPDAPTGPATVTRDLHLPVLFTRTASPIALTTTCAPARAAVGDTGSCAVQVDNPKGITGHVRVESVVPAPLTATAATGATLVDPHTALFEGELPVGVAAAPTIVPADGVRDPGYVDLANPDLNIQPTPVGDDVAIEPSGIAPFVFAGRTWTSLAVTSNGTIIAGGITDPADLRPPTTAFPDPARPNAVLAPFGTDLDGTTAPGIRIATLTSGTLSYLVVQWDLHVAGTEDARVFETWIGQNGVEDIFFTYDLASPPAATGLASPLVIGAENADGTGGESLPPGTGPTGDLQAVSTPARPPADLAFGIDWRAAAVGSADVVTRLHLGGAQGDVIDRQHVVVGG
jgi:subtilisin family serine protease